MKELLIRTGYSMTDEGVIQVRIVYSDGLTVSELEAVKVHLERTIAQKKGLEPKYEPTSYPKPHPDCTPIFPGQNSFRGKIQKQSDGVR